MTLRRYNIDLFEQFLISFPDRKGRYEVQHVDQSVDTIVVVETLTGDTLQIAARELTEMLVSGLAVRVKRLQRSKPFFKPSERMTARLDCQRRLNRIDRGRTCAERHAQSDVSLDAYFRR